MFKTTKDFGFTLSLSVDMVGFWMGVQTIEPLSSREKTHPHIPAFWNLSNKRSLLCTSMEEPPHSSSQVASNNQEAENMKRTSAAIEHQSRRIFSPSTDTHTYSPFIPLANGKADADAAPSPCGCNQCSWEGNNVNEPKM